MEGAAEIQEWELLHSPVGSDDGVLEIEDDAEGAIKLDYFALGPEERHSGGSRSDGRGEGDGLPDSDRVDPVSEPAVLGEPSRDDPGALWTADESSEVILEEVDLSSVQGREGSYSEGVGATAVAEGGSEGTGGVGNLGLDEGRYPGNFTVAGGRKEKWVWWKLPVELLKLCSFRVKPVWSFSVAAVLLGVVILGRRLWKKKPKSKRLPLKISVNDKKVSQYKIRAARINEAFSVVKQVPPMILSTSPTSGVTPWPVIALR